MALPMGGKRPGSGRKPGTPNKASTDLKALAQRYTTEAIEGLVAIAKDVGAPPAARVSAWDKVLDRAVGKAPQAITGDDGGPLNVRFTFALDRPGKND